MTTSHRLSSASNRATPATETNGYLGAYVGREATIDLSPDTFNCALRSVANEELDLAHARYLEHGDPVRCAVGISLVLRNFANEIFGEQRIDKLRRVSWLNFLLRTSGPKMMRPDVIETMSAALYGDPIDVELPGDCSFWFEAARHWIDFQRDLIPVTSCTTPRESNL